MRLAVPLGGVRYQPRKTLLCATASPSKEEEEDVLDETAMRAAEIHEVLTGLEEFKARIVDGAFGSLCTRSPFRVLRFAC